jgi:predicted DNA-binding protein with PD1-like motif
LPDQTETLKRVKPDSVRFPGRAVNIETEILSLAGIIKRANHIHALDRSDDDALQI